MFHYIHLHVRTNLSVSNTNHYCFDRGDTGSINHLGDFDFFIKVSLSTSMALLSIYINLLISYSNNVWFFRIEISHIC